jgi:regulator of RNase E activity RraA
MIQTPDIQRPDRSLIEGLANIGSATAAGELSRLGIRDAHIRGPQSWTPGKCVVGPALTLQFMPKREDLYGVDEYADPERQLHRHVLYHTQPGDIVVVDARGDLGSGIFGEMMLTYFTGRGGAGVVINGCIRDFPEAKKLGIGLWLQGVTPNFHTQTNLMPFATSLWQMMMAWSWCRSNWLRNCWPRPASTSSGKISRACASRKVGICASTIRFRKKPALNTKLGAKNKSKANN